MCNKKQSSDTSWIILSVFEGNIPIYVCLYACVHKCVYFFHMCIQILYHVEETEGGGWNHLGLPWTGPL